MEKDLLRDVEARIYFLTSEDGGRKSAAHSGYRGGFRYPGEENHWIVEYQFPDCAQAGLGQETRAYIRFLSPSAHVERLNPGDTFEVCEGGKLVATGEVTAIIDLAKNAELESDKTEGQLSAVRIRFIAILVPLYAVGFYFKEEIERTNGWIAFPIIIGLNVLIFSIHCESCKTSLFKLFFRSHNYGSFGELIGQSVRFPFGRHCLNCGLKRR